MSRSKTWPFEKRERCLVCWRKNTTVSKILLCDECGKSYESALRRDATTYGLLRWAAQRARRFARLEKR